jgi:hypothetical protein
MDDRIREKYAKELTNPRDESVEIQWILFGTTINKKQGNINKDARIESHRRFTVEEI